MDPRERTLKLLRERFLVEGESPSEKLRHILAAYSNHILSHVVNGEDKCPELRPIEESMRKISDSNKPSASFVKLGELNSRDQTCVL